MLVVTEEPLDLLVWQGCNSVTVFFEQGVAAFGKMVQTGAVDQRDRGGLINSGTFVIVVEIVFADCMEIDRTLIEQPGQDGVVAETVCKNLCLGESDLVGYVPQLISRFYAAHQTCIEDHVVHLHWNGRSE